MELAIILIRLFRSDGIQVFVCNVKSLIDVFIGFLMFLKQKNNKYNIIMINNI